MSGAAINTAVRRHRLSPQLDSSQTNSSLDKSTNHTPISEQKTYLNILRQKLYNNIEQYSVEDFVLENYNFHEEIKIEMRK